MRILIFILFVLASCNEEKRPEVEPKTSVAKVTGADTSVIPNEDSDTVSIDASLAGFYQSSLPCKGCDGSQQTLLLKKDGTFILEDYSRKPYDTLIKNKGHWTISNENIVLFADKVVIGKFFPVKDSLLTQERQGTILSDTASRLFALLKKENAAETPAWEKKKSLGVIGYFLGNEPFWNMELNNKNQLIFNLASPGEKYSFTNLMENDSARIQIYSGHDKKDSIRVTIQSRFCNDGMSDRLYEFSVSVTLNNQLYHGCGVKWD